MSALRCTSISENEILPPGQFPRTRFYPQGVKSLLPPGQFPRMRFYPQGVKRTLLFYPPPGGKISFSDIDLQRNALFDSTPPEGKISFSEIDLQRNALFDSTFLGIKSHSRKLTYNLTHSLFYPTLLLLRGAKSLFSSRVRVVWRCRFEILCQFVAVGGGGYGG